MFSAAAFSTPSDDLARSARVLGPQKAIQKNRSSLKATDQVAKCTPNTTEKFTGYLLGSDIISRNSARQFPVCSIHKEHEALTDGQDDQPEAVATPRNNE
jgi:hypothetical protein